MSKNFLTALKDGFESIHNFPRKRLNEYRREGVKVDEEGIHRFSFGEHKEYQLTVEPFGEEDEFLIALYKLGIQLTEKLHVKGVIRP